MEKNKRTLKRRIRKIMFLCLLITILLFGIMVIGINALVFKGQAEFITGYFSYSISETMNSDYFLKQMGIDDLKKLDPNAAKVQEWFDTLINSKENLPPLEPPSEVFEEKIGYEGGHMVIVKPRHENFTTFFNLESMVDVSITLDHQTIYSSRDHLNKRPLIHFDFGEDKENPKGFMQKLLNFFSTESSQDLKDNNGEVIGEVTASIHADILVGIFLGLVIIIIFVGLLALLIASIISKFLTITVTEPINKLDEKIKAAAAGDYETTINTHITMKRPLREVESLLSSTNTIIHKMKEYNDLLAAQNEELEAQNDELEAQKEEIEAQNEDLIESKRKIEDTQTLLVQSEKMASIGQLTAAITHEINTPLGAIHSNVQMCDMFVNLLLQNSTAQSDEELSTLLTQIKETNSISVMACQRVSEIIRSLKNFSRLDQAEFQEADVNEGIKSALVLSSNLWKRTITIHEDYGNIPTIKCFPGLLNQVFMNIIVNAVQSIEDKGDIYIKTYLERENVCISIKDTGKGIPEDDLSRIFDYGFTTKGAGIGMGLGLAICENIIQKHNGEIKVNTEVGKGTEFIICLPHEKPAEQPEAS